MQVTSLFAIFFAFLTLIAPLATSAIQINIPTITGLNATIACTAETTDDPGVPLTALTFVLTGPLEVTLPVNATGDGWTIRAISFGGKQVGVSPEFSILAPSQTGKKSMAVPIIGAVIATVIVVALLVLGLFFYMRRRRQMFAGPEFNLEASFPRRKDSRQLSRSFSSTSSRLTDPGVKASQSLELEKVEWETRLEEQFARARAATPDLLRGPTPAPRGATPPAAGPPTSRHAQPELLGSGAT
ncbi:hypothetical protein DFH08DRAFT_400988 [Mycena albidolilacea]|uniref:Uncharacterized protein n=1 Tax=Mycena albidolilacea TaxID=1033008 RepID=A0AAD6ZCY7_9AGAR|nr:hypothetical protein DFH08DRAFT_400988 [Mycena albidolilacea]